MGERVGTNKQDLSSAIWGILLGGIYFAAMWSSGAYLQEPQITYARLGTHLILAFFLFALWEKQKLKSGFWITACLAIYGVAFWFAGVKNFSTSSLVLFIFFQILLFLLVRSFWYYFFAQFILPVRSNAERKKIYERLIKKSTGAALFIEDGKLVGKEGESQKSGAGVIVLDSASAVVIRKNNQYTKAAGPGVLFTEKGETIAGAPVPLQTLKDTAGPRGEEDPFSPQEDSEGDSEYKARQRRRYETSGLTRDAVEIVPNITIIFKIDADPAQKDQDGSRFGYAEEPVRKAIWHTTINHKESDQTLYWNQLPINLAADLWREYLAKFRFEELFKAEQEIIKIGLDNESGNTPPQAPEMPQAPPEYSYGIKGLQCDILQWLNQKLENWLSTIDERISPPMRAEEEPIEAPVETKRESPTKETALKSITRFMADRLKKPYYIRLDRYGKLSMPPAIRPSPEYQFLKEHGIRVLSVSVNNLRFDKALEDNLISSWSNTWLKNAKAERSIIEDQIQVYKTRGKEKALRDYANALSKAIAKEKPRSQEHALQVLLRATRSEIIHNPPLHKEAEEDIQKITDLLSWINREGEPLG